MYRAVRTALCSTLRSDAEQLPYQLVIQPVCLFVCLCVCVYVCACMLVHVKNIPLCVQQAPRGRLQQREGEAETQAAVTPVVPVQSVPVPGQACVFTTLKNIP